MANVDFVKEGAVAIITVNRPQALNALNEEVINELDELITKVSCDPEIKSVIITGAGEKAFVAGADIKEMSELTPEEGMALSERGQALFYKVENMKKVTIAAVNGFALGGGCELAMACDIRYASAKAKFGQPEINLGIIPGYGGTQRLPRLIGMGRAKELIFSGDMIGAEEAYRVGLVNQIYAPEELMAKVKEKAEKLAGKSSEIIGQAKSAIHNGIDMDLASGCNYEARAFGLCFANKAQKEGMKAFLEKKKG